MLTYQVRPRIFRITSEVQPTFPAACEVRFHFQPPQPFGDASSGGHTAVRGVDATLLFDANSGAHSIESSKPLLPVDVTVKSPARTVHLSGATLTLTERFESHGDLENAINGVFFALPVLLNIPFADPPYIERVDGKIGSAPFRWELAQWRAEFRPTTQEQQEREALKAWERMGVIAAPHRRRLVAGLHYFHVACRLHRVGCTAGEFVAEVVLNLAKSLEALFPPSGDGNTRDAARAGLRALSFTVKAIECDFIPAMALRNNIDVGHVELGLFTMDQLTTIHAFTERAKGAFRDMFERLLDRIESGQAEIAPHALGPPKREAIELIERLKLCAAERERQPTAATSTETGKSPVPQ